MRGNSCFSVFIRFQCLIQLVYCLAIRPTIPALTNNLGAVLLRHGKVPAKLVLDAAQLDALQLPNKLAADIPSFLPLSRQEGHNLRLGIATEPLVLANC